MITFLEKIKSTLKKVGSASNRFFVNFLIFTTNNSLPLDSSDSKRAELLGLLPKTSDNDFILKCLLGGVILTSTGVVCYYYGPAIISAILGFFRPDGGSSAPSSSHSPAVNSINDTELLPQVANFISNTFISTDSTAAQSLVGNADLAVIASSTISTQQIFGGALAVTALRASGAVFTALLNQQPSTLSEFDLLWIKEMQNSAFLEAQRFLFHNYEPLQGYVFENIADPTNMLRIRQDLPILNNLFMRAPEQEYFEKLLNLKVRGPVAIQDLFHLILISNNIDSRNWTTEEHGHYIYAFYEQLTKLYPQFGR